MEKFVCIRFFASRFRLPQNAIFSAIFLQKIRLCVTMKTMKIKLSKEKLEKELNLKDEEKVAERQEEKPNKFFNIFSTVLIILLSVAIVVELVVIVTLNSKINNLEEEIDKLPSTTTSTALSSKDDVYFDEATTFSGSYEIYFNHNHNLF